MFSLYDFFLIFALFDSAKLVLQFITCYMPIILGLLKTIEKRMKDEKDQELVKRKMSLLSLLCIDSYVNLVTAKECWINPKRCEKLNTSVFRLQSV